MKLFVLIISAKRACDDNNVIISSRATVCWLRSKSELDHIGHSIAAWHFPTREGWRDQICKGTEITLWDCLKKLFIAIRGQHV